jgi:hypothetical protein
MFFPPPSSVVSSVPNPTFLSESSASTLPGIINLFCRVLFTTIFEKFFKAWPDLDLIEVPI